MIPPQNPDPYDIRIGDTTISILRFTEASEVSAKALKSGLIKTVEKQHEKTSGDDAGITSFYYVP